MCDLDMGVDLVFHRISMTFFVQTMHTNVTVIMVLNDVVPTGKHYKTGVIFQSRFTWGIPV